MLKTNDKTALKHLVNSIDQKSKMFYSYTYYNSIIELILVPRKTYWYAFYKNVFWERENKSIDYACLAC